MDIQSLKECCRTCSKSNEALISLENSWTDTLKYSDMLTFLVESRATIETNQYLSNYICEICEEQLILSYSFKKQCCDTQEKFDIIWKTELTSYKDHFVENHHESKDPEVKNKEYISIVIEDIVPNTSALIVNNLEIRNVEEINNMTTDCSNDGNNTADLISESDIEEEIAGTSEVNKKIRHCLKCNLEFPDNKKYQIHHRNFHYKRNLCPLCGKFIIYQSMEKHIASHDTNHKAYLCTLCGKSFKMNDNLKKHLRIHDDDKRYSCDYCGEKFIHWNSRRSHIRTHHTGVKEYECHICSKRFAQSSNMFRHIRLHTNDLPHQCTFCEKKFLSTTELKNHLVVHTKERNHLCDFCNKAFGTKKALQIHVKIHTGEKNYKCPVCSKSFSQAHVLRKHMKTHPDHPIPPPGVILSQKALNRQKLMTENNVTIFTNIL